MATLASVRFYERCRRRRAAQDFKAYEGLIDTPTNLGVVAAGADSAVSITLPANARLAISLDDITVAKDLSIKDTVNQVYGGGGVADFVQRLDVTPRGREVVVHRSLTCPSGDCKLYILDFWRRPYVIATATFS